jgi:hypothetical protein
MTIVSRTMWAMMWLAVLASAPLGCSTAADPPASEPVAMRRQGLGAQAPVGPGSAACDTCQEIARQRPEEAIDCAAVCSAANPPEAGAAPGGAAPPPPPPAPPAEGGAGGPICAAAGVCRRDGRCVLNCADPDCTWFGPPPAGDAAVPRTYVPNIYYDAANPLGACCKDGVETGGCLGAPAPGVTCYDPDLDPTLDAPSCFDVEGYLPPPPPSPPRWQRGACADASYVGSLHPRPEQPVVPQEPAPAAPAPIRVGGGCGQLPDSAMEAMIAQVGNITEAFRRSGDLATAQQNLQNLGAQAGVPADERDRLARAAQGLFTLQTANTLLETAWRKAVRGGDYTDADRALVRSLIGGDGCNCGECAMVEARVLEILGRLDAEHARYFRALAAAGVTFSNGVWDFSRADLGPAALGGNPTLKTTIAKYWGLQRAQALLDPCRTVAVIVERQVLLPPAGNTGAVAVQSVSEWLANIERRLVLFKEDYRRWLAQIREESSFSGGLRGQNDVGQSLLVLLSPAGALGAGGVGDGSIETESLLSLAPSNSTYTLLLAQIRGLRDIMGAPPALIEQLFGMLRTGVQYSDALLEQLLGSIRLIEGGLYLQAVEVAAPTPINAVMLLTAFFVSLGQAGLDTLNADGSLDTLSSCLADRLSQYAAPALVAGPILGRVVELALAGAAWVGPGTLLGMKFAVASAFAVSLGVSGGQQIATCVDKLAQADRLESNPDADGDDLALAGALRREAIESCLDGGVDIVFALGSGAAAASYLRSSLSLANVLRLPDPDFGTFGDRVGEAQNLLGRSLSESQIYALLAAHLVAIDRPGAAVGRYTRAEIAEKARILAAGDYSRAEVRLLMERDVAGRQGATPRAPKLFGAGVCVSAQGGAFPADPPGRYADERTFRGLKDGDSKLSNETFSMQKILDGWECCLADKALRNDYANDTDPRLPAVPQGGRMYRWAPWGTESPHRFVSVENATGNVIRLYYTPFHYNNGPSPNWYRIF